jgi:N-acetylneuraminic acid mutarotase
MNLPEPRSSAAVAAYENQLYVTGGEVNGQVAGTTLRFDLANNVWLPLASKPTPVSDASAAVIGGKIYVPGGRLAGGDATDVLEIYDPVGDQWTSGNSLPAAVSAYALAAYEGRLYVFGGRGLKGISAAVYEYEPAKDVWSTKTPMPTRRAFSGAAVVGGKIYVAGGTDGKKALAVNEMYLPQRDVENGNPWTVKAAMPQGRYGMGLTAMADIIMVVGGIGDSVQPMPSLEYFHQKDRWQEFGSLGPKVWAYLGSAPVGAQLYILGGKIEGAPTTSTLSFQALYTLAIPMVR